LVKAHPDLDAAALQSSIERRAAPLILDVRSRGEFEAGRIPGALNVPYWRVPFETGSSFGSRDEPVVVYCGLGPRARFAAAVLRFRGFSQAVCLKGHMSEWRRRGLPERHGPAPAHQDLSARTPGETSSRGRP
jgi:rhodanese-related sulfurtransferase